MKKLKILFQDLFSAIFIGNELQGKLHWKILEKHFYGCCLKLSILMSSCCLKIPSTLKSIKKSVFNTLMVRCHATRLVTSHNNHPTQVVPYITFYDKNLDLIRRIIYPTWDKCSTSHNICSKHLFKLTEKILIIWFLTRLTNTFTASVYQCSPANAIILFFFLSFHQVMFFCFRFFFNLGCQIYM